jgi:hypothetical protein
MNLQPKIRRALLTSAIVLVILIALGAFFTWTKFFREEKEVFANEEEHFKYGWLFEKGRRFPAHHEQLRRLSHRDLPLERG